MSIVRAYGIALLAFGLGACATELPPSPAFSSNLRGSATMPAAVADTRSNFDQMRGALPTFDLRQLQIPAGGRQEVSIVRDITFGPGDTILTDIEVTRLAPLQTYLRLHPAMAVRIEGYGDGTHSADREKDLSSARADAVARALYVDMRVSNSIVAKPALKPEHKLVVAQAEITFLLPQ